MYRKILVDYDTGDQAKDALAVRGQLAESTGAHLVVAGEAGFGRQIEAAAEAVGAEPVGAEVEATP